MLSFNKKNSINSFLKFISKNKLYSIIELFGLSFSLCFVIIIFTYARQEYRATSSCFTSDNIYAAGFDKYIGMTYGTAEYLAPKTPEIVEWCRYGEPISATLRVKGEAFPVYDVAAVDSNFFNFFDFKFEGTNKSKAWESKNSVVISKKFANTAFAGRNPIGETVSINWKDTLYNFNVTGIIEDFKNTIFNPKDIILNINHPIIENSVPRMDNFGSTVPFFKVAPGTDIEALNNKIDKAYSEYWKSWGSFIKESKLIKGKDIYFSKDIITYSLFVQNNKSFVDILFVVSFLLLLCAILNYINLTAAQAQGRAKEMATRRLLGSSLKDIVYKYILESELFTFCSFVIGFLLALLFKNKAQEILGTQLEFFSDFWTIIYFVVIILIVGFLSGVLPAFMVSKFSPINVVKGEFKVKSKMVFSKVFIVIQNVVGIVLIVVSMVMLLQLNFLVNLPLGYNTKDIIAINMSDRYNLIDNVKPIVERLPMVKRVGVANGNTVNTVMGQYFTLPDGSDFLIRHLRADSVTFDMLGFKVVEKFSDPLPGRVWYSKLAANILNVSIDNILPQEGFEACGIIDNVHFFGRISDISPIIVQMIPENFKWKSVIFVETIGDKATALQAIQKATDDYIVSYTNNKRSKPAEMSYLDDKLDEGLSETKKTILFTISFMFIAIIISALGMFAMSLYYSNQQMKSIAIRKVFGASAHTIIFSLVKQFVLMTLISAIISIPIAIVAVRKYLSGFSLKIDFPWWVILASIIITLFIVFLSVFFITRRAALNNPIDTIKKD